LANYFVINKQKIGKNMVIEQAASKSNRLAGTLWKNFEMRVID